MAEDARAELPILLDYCELGGDSPNGWNDEGRRPATFTIYSRTTPATATWWCTWQLDVQTKSPTG